MNADATRSAEESAARLEAQEQGHLVRHAEGLPAAARPEFLARAAAVPWEEVVAAVGAPAPRSPPVLRPPQALTWKRQEREPGLTRRLSRLGRGLLAGGHVATVLLAGGQSTRLARPGAKGTVVLGPEPYRTLYRVHSERVAAAGRVAKRPVPFFVVVSGATEAQTAAAFAALLEEGVLPEPARLVRQDELPALDDEGRALLAGPGVLASAPDGHGGFLRVLQREGILQDLEAGGIDVLTTFQVDNPLALPLDPVALGWMVDRRAQALGKAVKKRDPSERVGTFARDLEGRTRVVEYSEAPEEGYPPEVTLGSIAVNAFGVAWLRRTLSNVPSALPLHRARKRVPHLAPDGTRIEPAAPNAWKLERFLFDLFPLASRVEVHEVLREREFAPVKEAEGLDTLDAARALVDAEVRRWHTERGRPAPDPPSLRPSEMTDDV